jgi:hypothetical protein
MGRIGPSRQELNQPFLKVMLVADASNGYGQFQGDMVGYVYLIGSMGKFSAQVVTSYSRRHCASRHHYASRRRRELSSATSTWSCRAGMAI